ncbi:NAD(P)H-dependent amine dehydrogenase family protein [Streptomyces sp. JW3]|uniref:NAD(P)H-dependent amine dehydrogenase family protein n=1 Tax=Streptomyces sp. JW3 TaxID=3456955 RepID=UPI003FA41125
MSAAGRPYRVVQWATGTIGARSLRAVVEHPHLELAGVHVHTPGKDGRDAGELCGLAPTGVTATRDVARLRALKADCVLHMPLVLDVEEVCRLLESGLNVVTTRGEFHHPGSMDPGMRERVEAACREGGTSIHSTGSSPGFITEAVPLVLTSVARRVDSLTVEEFADLSRRPSPDLLFGVMGFGVPPGEFDEGRLTRARTSFGPSLRLLAETLGLPPTTLEASGEVATARHRTDIAAGPLRRGTVAAQRLTVAAVHAGRPRLRFRATWYCTRDLDPDWRPRDTGWRLTVDGDAPLDVEIRLPVPLERMAEISPAYTANRAVNAVPFVCAAEPGIRTCADLPQITAAPR